MPCRFVSVPAGGLLLDGRTSFLEFVRRWYTVARTTGQPSDGGLQGWGEASSFIDAMPAEGLAGFPARFSVASLSRRGFERQGPGQASYGTRRTSGDSRNRFPPRVRTSGSGEARAKQLWQRNKWSRRCSAFRRILQLWMLPVPVSQALVMVSNSQHRVFLKRAAD